VAVKREPDQVDRIITAAMADHNVSANAPNMNRYIRTKAQRNLFDATEQTESTEGGQSGETPRRRVTPDPDQGKSDSGRPPAKNVIELMQEHLF